MISFFLTFLPGGCVFRIILFPSDLSLAAEMHNNHIKFSASCVIEHLHLITCSFCFFFFFFFFCRIEIRKAQLLEPYHSLYTDTMCGKIHRLYSLTFCLWHSHFARSQVTRLTFLYPIIHLSCVIDTCG